MARGFTQYAYAFVQQPAELGAPPDQAQAAMLRAGRLYLRARDYGVEGLKLARGVTAQGLRTPAGLSRVPRGDVAPPHWTAPALAAGVAAHKRDLGAGG